MKSRGTIYCGFCMADGRIEFHVNRERKAVQFGEALSKSIPCNSEMVASFVMECIDEIHLYGMKLTKISLGG